MATITLTCDSSTIQKMQKHYQANLLNSAPYTVFVAKTANARISAYQSGKVVFQGPHAEKEAAKWGNEIASKSHSTLPEGFDTWSVIGSDEVGNGSYFGPLVVAAAYVEKSKIPELQALGVKDSKMLNDEKMKRIAPKIKRIIPYQLLIVSPQKYNAVQPHYNATTMKSVLHNQALALLEEKIQPAQPQAILIDQFATKERFLKDTKNEVRHPQTPIYTITKGEQYHIAVAAASILARVTFLEQLEQLGDSIQEVLPSGAGANVDEVAAHIINQYGIDTLARLAKMHFANTEKAIKLQKKS